MFAPEVYVERRRRLRELLGKGVVLLLGSWECPMNYPANVYPFRQDSSFLYFFGIDRPDLAAVMDLEANRDVLFGRTPTMDDLVWSGPQPSLDEWGERVGVEDARPWAELGPLLRQALRQERPVHFLPAHSLEHLHRVQPLLPGLSDEQVLHGSSPLIRAIVALRSTKTAEEIEEIEAAIAVTRDMQLGAMRMTRRPGVYEYAVAGAMEGIALARGGRLAFPTIFSIHGEVLHNYDHSHRMEAGRMAVNDCGAESPLHYAGDITRTLPVGGQFTPRQRDVYTIVLAAQEAAIAAIRPGVEYRDVHRLACLRIFEGLRGLGLVRGDADEAVEAGAHTLFFPHGIGHMLGLDVHDMEALGEDFVGYTETIRRRPEFGWKSLRLARAVEPGFAVTVEPGLYFIPALIDQWKAARRCEAFINYEAVEAYRDFGGIRIEDDVLVTAEGRRILGPPIPKTLDEVEA
jgi:Xaa-Pro aminopeptidase